MTRGIKPRLKKRLHLSIKLSLPEELRAVKPVSTGVRLNGEKVSKLHTPYVFSFAIMPQLNTPLQTGLL